MDERTFDWSELLDELRCHTSEWLEAARVEAVRAQRRWRVRELAITAVLDERGEVDDTHAAKDGTSTKTARRTARRLKRQPNVAKAAAEGRLSQEQLDALADLADGDPDAEERWAAEGSKWSPEDLHDELRKRRKPSTGTTENATPTRPRRAIGPTSSSTCPCMVRRPWRALPLARL